MRIIDKRHDYYDVGMGLGFDDSIVYIRTEKEIDEHPLIPHYSQWETGRWLYIGFCGKIYPVCRISYGFQTDFCYSINDVDKFVSAYFNKFDKASYFGEKNNKYNQYKYTRGNLKIQFEEHKYSYYKSLFREYNTPIFAVVPFDRRIYINPLLRPYHFYKVMDPYTAFQEISMYVGGVLLAPTKPIPVMSDSIKIQSRGFDKYSFRKPPRA